MVVRVDKVKGWKLQLLLSAARLTITFMSNSKRRLLHLLGLLKDEINKKNLKNLGVEIDSRCKLKSSTNARTAPNPGVMLILEASMHYIVLDYAISGYKHQ
ncbi:hypothetical protein AMECASPLE_019978 [Ameca splendens]|uniref:Uncharacterized protein n=1 Tax=Ameca splendens TaxID=208324 RepID=A0ABV0ZNT7_9TELE